MTQPDNELSDVQRGELYARRKKQVWQVVLVMTISSCVGGAVLFYLLYLLLQKILP